MSYPPRRFPAWRNTSEQFSRLGRRRWYSVQLGSVYLIALDSNSGHPSHSFDPDSPQQQWLDAQLKHLPPEVNFVFFLIHMPLINDPQSEVVADLPEPSQIKLRRYLEAEAPGAHAKFIVVSGHVHTL